MWGRIIAIVFLVASYEVSFSQLNYNSPYSRFGIGDIQHQGLGYSRGMGGLGTSFATQDYINFQNPALVQATKQTIFDIGIEGQYRNLSSDYGTSSSFDGTLSYFATTFSGQENSRKWYSGRYSLGLGLMPYSIVDYNVTSNVSIQGSDNESLTISDKGNGIINKALIINSFNIINPKNQSKHYKTSLSAGLESSYLFGKIDRSTESVFGADAYYTAKINTEHYRGFLLKPGLYFNQVSKVFADTIRSRKGEIIDTFYIPTHRVNFGMTTTAPTQLKGDIEQSIGYFTSQDKVIDTSTSVLFDNVNLSLNSRVRFGLSYEKITPYRLYSEKTYVSTTDTNGITKTTVIENYKTASWKIGIDFWLNNWSNYENTLDDNEYSNSFGLAIGGTYTQDVKGLGVANNKGSRKFKNYASGIVYRFGVNYETLPYEVNGQSISELGINVGFGLPLSSDRTSSAKYINLNFAYATRGTQDAGLVQENIFKVLLNFNISRADWFYKRPVGL